MMTLGLLVGSQQLSAQLTNLGMLYVGDNAILYSEGNVTNNAGATFEFSGTNAPYMEFKGDFSNSATGNFERGAGKVMLTGSSNQQIVSGGDGFYLLEVNKPSSNLVIQDQTSVHAQLNLTNGLVQTTTNKELILEAGANVSSGSVTSYLEGPVLVKTAGTSEVTLPSGKNGAFAPCAITPSTSSPATWNVEFVNAGHPNSSDGVLAPLHHVSDFLYWNIGRTAGTPNARIRLYWNATTGHGSVVAPSDMMIGRWNGTQWEAAGSSTYTYTATGNAGAGNVISNEFESSFGVFTLASNTSTSVLPVELLDFQAVYNAERDAVEVWWSTATELNTSHFVVERSADAKVFEAIAEQPAAGFSNNELQYQDLDAATLQGVSYYRLKSIDFDGSFEYSPVRSVHLRQGANNSFSVYPNPVRRGDRLHVAGTTKWMEVQVLNSAGAVVQSWQGMPGTDAMPIAQTLQAGMYMVRLRSADGSTTIQRLIVL